MGAVIWRGVSGVPLDGPLRQGSTAGVTRSLSFDEGPIATVTLGAQADSAPKLGLACDNDPGPFADICTKVLSSLGEEDPTATAKLELS